MSVIPIQRVADSAGVLHSAQRALQFGSGLSVTDHPNDTLVGVNGDGQVTGYLAITASIPPGAATVKQAPYNAVGDGVANDFGPVQSAFAAAADFFYPVGTYRMSTTGTIGTASSMHRFVSGGKLSVDTGVVVTIHGTIDAGRYQIFSGLGAVVLDAGVQAFPEWWGAVGDFTSDDTAALGAACTSGNAVVELQAGKRYRFTSSITMTKAVTIRGPAVPTGGIASNPPQSAAIIHDFNGDGLIWNGAQGSGPGSGGGIEHIRIVQNFGSSGDHVPRGAACKVTGVDASHQVNWWRADQCTIEEAGNSPWTWGILIDGTPAALIANCRLDSVNMHISTGGLGGIGLLGASGIKITSPELHDSNGHIVIDGKTFAVSGAASGTGGNVRLTIATHNLCVFGFVKISGVGGTTEANGEWNISAVPDNTHIEIPVAFVHAYTSGGVVSVPSSQVQILGGDCQNITIDHADGNIQVLGTQAASISTTANTAAPCFLAPSGALTSEYADPGGDATYAAWYDRTLAVPLLRSNRGLAIPNQTQFSTFKADGTTLVRLIELDGNNDFRLLPFDSLRYIFGAPPSTAGAAAGDLVFPNAAWLTWNNAAGSAASRILRLDGSNNVVLGGDAAGVTISNTSLGTVASADSVGWHFGGSLPIDIGSCHLANPDGNIFDESGGFLRYAFNINTTGHKFYQTGNEVAQLDSNGLSVNKIVPLTGTTVSVNGVAISGTAPSTGQVLTATSPTAANWQTPASPAALGTYSWTNTATLASGGSATVADPAASTIPTGKSGLAVCNLIFKDNVNQSTSSAIICSNFKNVSGTLTVQSAGGGGSIIASANGTGGYNIGGGTNVFSVSGTQLQFTLGGNASGNSCSVMATVVLYYF